MSLGDWEVIGPLAYMGKEDCRDVRCRRLLSSDGLLGEGCLGWHCSYCDEPCGSQGHKCDVSTTLLQASQKINEEGSS